MNIRMNKVYPLIIILVLISSNSYGQNWPISQADDNCCYNRVNGTFGEIHPTNGDHFHVAIDIDIATPNCPARTIENGRVQFIGGDFISIEHAYPSAGLYHRRSRYFHINNNLVSLQQQVNQGDQITQIDNSAPNNGNHLHFEMWQRTNGTWYRLNPLNNNEGWQVGSPIDNTDPQINDIIFAPVTQPNGAASGYVILSSTAGAITNYNQGTAKIHFQNKSQGPTQSIFNFTNDKLLLFGNIGPIVNCRDRTLNAPTISSGNGLTVQQINYSIENNLKYNIEFDKLANGTQAMEEQVFHTAFNNPTNSRLFGNDDYIEMYSSDNTYLYIHKQINNIQSNGIWSTKARNNSQQVHNTTPLSLARYPGESLYPDGEINLQFHVEDAAGRNDDEDFKIILDNFKPYIKKVEIRKNNISGSLVYSGNWAWDGVNLASSLITSGVIESS